MKDKLCISDKEKLFQNLLLVTDLDGTLLNSENKVGEEDRTAIRFFIENGGCFTICTGRMTQTCKTLDCDMNAPMITTDGTIIYDVQNQKIVWSIPMEESFIPLTEQVAAMFPDIGVEVFTEEHIYVHQYNPHLEFHRKLEPYEIVMADRIKNIPEERFSKIVFVGEHDRLEKAEEYIQAEIKKNKLPFSVEYSLPLFLEMRSSYAGKGVALKQLSRFTEIPLSRTIAVGDNWNDLSMFQEAGFKVAVGNAEPGVKEKVDYVVSDHNHNPISDVIEFLRDNKYI